MSFLKNILRPFVEFEEDKKDEAAPAPKPMPRSAPAEKGKGNPAPAGRPPAPAEALPAAAASFEKYFDDLLEEANRTNPMFEGTDFKEFQDSKTDVEAIQDEPTKYRTAFNVLKRTGLTKGRLIATAQEYIKLVERDVRGFESAYAQQYTAEVAEKERLLQEKAEEVRQLQERMAALDDELKQLSADVQRNKEQLSAKKTAFIQAGENKLNELRSELQKIEQYF